MRPISSSILPRRARRSRASFRCPEGMSLDQYEQELIRQALKKADGNKSQAARCWA